jgi:hypothetical protein
MIYYVHRDPKFENYLNILREKGGTALSAAKKAEEILQRILMKGRENSLKVARLTQKGELRIKCGIKYDLGNGYRLVCAKKGAHLILLYIGSHDDCDRWLEHNKGLHFEIDDNGDNKLATRNIPSSEYKSLLTTELTTDPVDEYEEQLMKRIDDKVLRNIFCGLVEK